MIPIISIRFRQNVTAILKIPWILLEETEECTTLVIGARIPDTNSLLNMSTNGIYIRIEKWVWCQEHWCNNYIVPHALLQKYFLALKLKYISSGFMALCKTPHLRKWPPIHYTLLRYAISNPSWGIRVVPLCWQQHEKWWYKTISFQAIYTFHIPAVPSGG